MNEDIQRKYQDYGDDALYSFKVTEGICYIRSWSEGDEATIGSPQNDFISVVAYITFVDRETMTDLQNVAIEEAEREYLNGYYRSLFHDVVAKKAHQLFQRN